jgi:hypothetical protein
MNEASPSPELSVPTPESKTPKYTQVRITEFYQAIGLPKPSVGREDNHVESYNAPLDVFPHQTGLLVWDFSTADMISRNKRSAVIIEVPRAFADRRITLHATTRPLDTATLATSTDTIFARVLGGAVFEVTAVDENGTPVHLFSESLEITLIVPESLREESDLGVYYLEENASEWVRIPDAVFTDISASFFVNHLTRFAIISASGTPSFIPTTNHSTQDSLWWLWIIALVVVCWIYAKCRQKDEHKL